MSALPASTLLLGSYPERDPVARNRPFDRLRRSLSRLGAARAARTDASANARSLPLQELRARLWGNLGDRDAQDALLERVADACRASLGITPYPGQREAARALLDGRLVEMATGEGKTLAVALAAACGALSGRPVHVVTANDYLAARDANAMSPLYRTLGLGCGVVTGASTPAQRRQAYDCDITYCPGRELAFDYLRDRLVRPRALSPLIATVDRLARPSADRATLLRGLWMAIVDEADSVLLDEALMPLILSAPVVAADREARLASALEAAAALEPDEHFLLDAHAQSARLTADGRRQLDADAAASTPFRTTRHREEFVQTALAALYLHERDRHYVVRNGSVQIVDEATGRAAPGRIWSNELHAFVCLKEGCPLPPLTQVATQITYQRFFPRYLHLSGTSGTLHEERRELESVYGLPVVGIPLRRPSRLHRMPTRVVADAETQAAVVVARIQEMQARGRPVLIAMDSVIDAERLSGHLHATGIDHQLLHARQDADEAACVAAAGQPGQVTLTTNMAGRGTDIRLHPQAEASGGLHVIACQHNRSRRIDRQLYGRAGRQGDPGSCERVVHRFQPLFVRTWGVGLAHALSRLPLMLRGWWADRLLELPQWREEYRARAVRRAMIERDRTRSLELDLGPEP
jgi:preprotein translocase subunit SecA